MSYSEKVSKCKPIVDRMSSLYSDEQFNIIYKGDTYTIKAYSGITGEGDKISYSVWNGFRGMNVSKVGKTSLTLYTYDMMSQRTTYRLDLTQCSIVDPQTDQTSI